MPPPVIRKFWIDRNGIEIPVSDSHEEYANSIGHELENLLAQGWVRVQSVPPPYLYLDYRLPLNALQAVAVAMLFESRFDQVVVEFEGIVRGFVDGR